MTYPLIFQMMDKHFKSKNLIEDQVDFRKIYINKNVNVRLFKILNLRKLFTDCFEILTQRRIRIRACFYIPTII